ncbi:MAG: NUDIX domain-containing protein [Chloroflexota bacterium]|nr:MAG: NUDIX domain-containing protein [Chloroflexota bacterium]
MLIKLAYRLVRVYWFLFRPVTMGVRVILYKDEQFVLVKHTYQDAWYLPGGGVKRGETLEDAIRREAAEDCGATLHQVELLGIYTNFKDYKSDHITLFLSTDFTLAANSDQEIAQVSSFSIDKLPEKTSPGSRSRIEAFINDSLEPSGLW